MEQFPIAEIARNHGVEKMIYNRGIGGYTTDDFLTNIDTVLFDLEPSKIFINIGTNDMNIREDGEDWNAHLLTNYETILKQIKKRLPETEVYMMAYYPVNPVVASDDVKTYMLQIRTNENLQVVNRQMEELARKNISIISLIATMGSATKTATRKKNSRRKDFICLRMLTKLSFRILCSISKIL